jgi:DNA polymerase-1
VILTFHPAYVLRDPDSLKYVLQDLEKVGTAPPTPEGYVICPPNDHYLVVDVETNCLYPWDDGARLLLVGFERVKERIPQGLQHYFPGGKGLRLDGPFVGHNIKFDLRWLDWYGKGKNMVLNEVYDTRILAHLLDENRPSLSLEALMRTEFGQPAWKVDRTKMEDLSTQELVNYNAKDVLYTHALFCKLYNQVKEQGLLKLALYENQVLLCLHAMEMRGMKICRATNSGYDQRLQDFLVRLTDEMRNVAGEPINPASTRQLQAYLFGKRQMRPVRKTATGFSTDDATLIELLSRAPEDPFLTCLAKYRDVWKEWSAFVRKLPRWVDQNGFIHPTYNQTSTVTGRLSCQEPNVQQAPRGYASRYKACFVSRYLHGKILVADYSQLELRVGAWYTRDENMLAVFRTGGDIHEATRAHIYGSMEEPEQREVAKRVNFGIFYGAGAPTLARTAGISVQNAQAYRRAWFQAYPGVKRWIKEVEQVLQEHWTLETPFGRQRRFTVAGLSPEMASHVQAQAINFPIQSLAADLTKLAMLSVDRVLKSSRTDALLIGQVHDSLIIDCPADFVEPVVELVVSTMKEPFTSSFGFTFDVPLEVEVKIGTSWHAADIGEEQSYDSADHGE